MNAHDSGLLIIDKPAGMTSAAVTSKVKRWLGVQKVGHTGTLDPFATGVLICCINKATRLAGLVMNGHKTYDALLHLGIETDTQDLEGNITGRAEGTIDFSMETLMTVFDRFKGHSRQQPPVYSALKHNGVPLYKLARQGKPVCKPPRPIEITELNITQVDLPLVRFEVTCSAGTYIRALCADIGSMLGCGGHLRELRRTRSAGFSIDRAVTLNALEQLTSVNDWKSAMIPMKEAVRHFPICVADPNRIEKIRTGRALTREDMNGQSADQEGFIAVVNENDDLLAILNHEKNSTYYPYCCVLIS